MSLRSLEYAVMESITAIRRNFVMSLASVFTMTASLTVLSLVALLGLGLSNATESELRKFEISVWLDRTAMAADVDQLAQGLRSMDHVAAVTYISAEEYWEMIRQDWKGRVNLKEAGPKSLTGHFQVRLSDPHYTEATVSKIKKLSHVEEALWGESIVDTVVRVYDVVKIVGLACAGAFLLFTTFIVSNTIRLMIYARRREIRIMQLVGASNWFIRLPLVFEGTILGVVGAGVACLLLFGGSYYLNNWLTHQTVLLPLAQRFSANIEPLWLYGSVLGLGWIIGAIGSLISIQRFLKA